MKIVPNLDWVESIVNLEYYYCQTVNCTMIHFIRTYFTCNKYCRHNYLKLKPTIFTEHVWFRFEIKCEISLYSVADVDFT